jgi:hypothetical protein
MLIFMRNDPVPLPPDLQAALPRRSDRAAITYRKWLRELGVTFGTA